MGCEGIQESLQHNTERCDKLSVSQNHEDFPPPSPGHSALSQPGLQGNPTEPDNVSGPIFQPSHNQRDSGIFRRRAQGRTQPCRCLFLLNVIFCCHFQVDELRSILSTLNSHQTSICKGIPEEKLITWANRKNISQILIERFSSKVVFRDRNCSYVMLETDQADICRSCAMLLSTSSLDMMEEQELECPFPDCERAFKYQGALDKHIMKHNQVSPVHPAVSL